MARLKNAEHAEFMFKTAITVALRAGAHDKVALAALTMIEEVDQLPRRTMFDAFEMALEMPASMGPEVIRRVANVGPKVIKRAAAKSSNEEATEVDCRLPTDLEYEMLVCERSLLRSALVNAKGSLVQAARAVGLKPGKLLHRLRVEHQPTPPPSQAAGPLSARGLRHRSSRRVRATRRRISQRPTPEVTFRSQSL